MKVRRVIAWAAALMFALLGAALHAESAGFFSRATDSIIAQLIDSQQTMDSARYRTAIAVCDFEERTQTVHNVGFAFAELLTSKLHATGRFQVIERQKIDQILKEIEFQLSDLADQTNVTRLGQFAAADMLLVGNVSEFADRFFITVRLLEVETARVLLSTSVEVPARQLLSAIKTYLPTRHSIGVSSFNILNTANLDGTFVSLAASYAYQVWDFGEISSMLGIAFTGIYYYAPDVYDVTFFMSFPTYYGMVGYSQYFASGRLQPFVQILGGLIKPTYFHGTAAYYGYVWGGIVAAGIKINNPILTLKPTIGWCLSTADGYTENDDMGPVRRTGRINNLVLNLEMLVKF